MRVTSAAYATVYGEQYALLSWLWDIPHTFSSGLMRSRGNNLRSRVSSHLPHLQCPPQVGEGVSIVRPEVFEVCLVELAEGQRRCI